MHYVIGCGGGGCLTVLKLCKLAGSRQVTCIDGDTIERKNLDRQLFKEEDIGRNKASALATIYGCTAWPEWFHADTATVLGLKAEDILFCCADNHACRKAVLAACDDYGCRAAIAGNEYTDAEAYWYEPTWRDTPNDPRVFYPEIMTDSSGDPLAPEGCTGAAQERSPQLVLANDWASGLALHLYWFHVRERPSLERSPEVESCWPVHHKVSMWKHTTIRKGDRK